MTEGSALYHRSMAFYADRERDGGALQHKVWDNTPWMTDAFTGRCGQERDLEMRTWCEERFGDEAWPIHGKAGNWNRGGATIYGWTWFGFATEAMMHEFMGRWDDTPRPHKMEPS